jgi:hypothetical protein
MIINGKDVDGAANFSANAYFRQFMLPPEDSAPNRPFQAISVATEYANASLARQLAAPAAVCPADRTPPHCSRVYSIPDLADEAYVFEDFKYAQLGQDEASYYVEHGVMRWGQYVLQVDLISRLSSDAPQSDLRAMEIEKMRQLSSRFKQRLQAARAG